MTRNEFYAAVADMLEIDANQVTGESVLKELPSWDSLAVLSFIALADSELDVIVNGGALLKCKTVDDLITLLPGKVQD